MILAGGRQTGEYGVSMKSGLEDRNNEELQPIRNVMVRPLVSQ